MVVSGKVINVNCDIFFVDIGQRILQAKLRKKINHNKLDILVGDNVELSIQGDSVTIERPLARTNRLKRPSVANVDCAAILITVRPAPDLSLVDKIIINCINEGIQPIILISKADIISQQFIDLVTTNFKHACEIFVISALNGEGLSQVMPLLNGKTTCLIGQSAVGKSSLINALQPSMNIEVGQLSQRSGRGKHTTRKSHLFKLNNSTYIIDSSGFSLFSLDFVQSDTLRLYYPEFESYLNKCRYHACMHINEPECVVRQAAQNHVISLDRYQRYVQLFNELVTHEKRKYN